MDIFYFSALILLIVAYFVFRRLARQEYRLLGRLSPRTAALQLFTFLGLFALPYTFNPPVWPWFWLLSGPTSIEQQIVGLVLILLGMGLAFGMLFWLGWRRSLGLEMKGLARTGFYRITRNPQVLGGYLMVIGVALQWPSWDAVTFVGVYGILAHWMILSEEEHLLRVFKKEYEAYCQKTPRYLLFELRRK